MECREPGCRRTPAPGHRRCEYHEKRVCAWCKRQCPTFGEIHPPRHGGRMCPELHPGGRGQWALENAVLGQGVTDGYDMDRERQYETA
jgi:hypothetical protein